MNRYHTLSIAILVIATFAACGGGGGGTTSPTPPVGNATTAPASGATAAASNTPFPNPTATATSTSAGGVSGVFTGTVVSSNASNAPVSGATVTIGTGWSYQGSGYAVSGVLATTTTAANGTFSITVSPTATVIEVDAAGLVSAHRPIMSAANGWGVWPGANLFGTIGLPTATADENAELTQVNSDRARLGTGNGALALTLDADMVLSGRATVTNEGTLGYYNHEQPGTNYEYAGHYSCTVLVGAYCGNPIFQQENLGSGPSQTVLQFEAGIISLGPGEGHYDNVLSANNLFIGFGEYQNGIAPAGSGVSTTNYQSQEFLTTSDNPPVL